MLLQKDPPGPIDIAVTGYNDHITGELEMVEQVQHDHVRVATLGQVMFTLLQANELTWNSAFKRLGQGVTLEGAFADSLAALDHHAAQSSSSQRDIFESLIDKILKISIQHRVTSKRVIQYLMLFSRNSQSFRTFLSDGLTTEGNRFKMAVLCVIDDLTERWEQKDKASDVTKQARADADAVPRDQNTSDTAGRKMAEDITGTNPPFKIEIENMAPFVPQCIEIATLSQAASRLSVAASDVALSLSRFYLRMLAQPNDAHMAPTNVTTLRISEVHATKADQVEMVEKLVSNLISLVHTIKKWLNSTDIQSNVAWHEIETFLMAAKTRLGSTGNERSSLEILNWFWAVVSRCISWKHVRAKPKTMLKAAALESNMSAYPETAWPCLLGSLCSLLIMNGERYQVLVPAKGEAVSKLDQPLLDASLKLSQDFLNTKPIPPGFEDVGSDLASLLHHIDGSSSQSLNLYEMKMLRQRLFPQLENGSIRYSTSLDIVTRVLSSTHQATEPLAEHFTFINDISGYIGHANKEISHLAQTCVVLTLNASPEDVDNGQLTPKTTRSSHLSPGNLMVTINNIQTPTLNSTDARADKMKHLMDAIEQWSKQASKEAWTQVLAMLVQKTYACRNDKVYTAIWKCISTHIGSDTDLMRIVTTACVDTMEQQPRLTEIMIGDSTDEGALAIQDLTFARLCPLLILLAFPETAFNNVVCDIDVNKARDNWFDDAIPESEPNDQRLSMRLLQALLVRAEHILEIQYVRPVALTVLAGLFGSDGRFLTLCKNKLERLLESWKNYHVAIKYWIYGFCVWAKGPWATANHLQAKDATLVKQLQNMFSAISQWSDSSKTDDNNDEFKKLKMGAVEANALAQTITTNMSL